MGNGEERPDEQEAWREQNPPGSVSDQNQEEAESGHGKAKGEEREQPRREDDNSGASSEGSQSTGHPEHAG
jgi:hypothetical protein